MINIKVLNIFTYDFNKLLYNLKSNKIITSQTHNK